MQFVVWCKISQSCNCWQTMQPRNDAHMWHTVKSRQLKGKKSKQCPRVKTMQCSSLIKVNIHPQRSSRRVQKYPSLRVVVNMCPDLSGNHTAWNLFEWKFCFIAFSSTFFSLPAFFTYLLWSTASLSTLIWPLVAKHRLCLVSPYTVRESKVKCFDFSVKRASNFFPSSTRVCLWRNWLGRSAITDTANDGTIN